MIEPEITKPVPKIIKIYKLNYPTTEEGKADLLEKGIVNEEFRFSYPIHAVVELPKKVVMNQETMEVIEVLPESSFDIMSEEDEEEDKYDFGDNLVTPITPDHNFSGWKKIETRL